MPLRFGPVCYMFKLRHKLMQNLKGLTGLLMSQTHVEGLLYVVPKVFLSCFQVHDNLYFSLFSL